MISFRGRVYINAVKIKEKKNRFFLSQAFPTRGVKNNNIAPLIKVSISLFWYTFKVFINIKTYAYNKAISC